MHRLKVLGSETGPETRVGWRGQNLWSVLRNLKDRQRRDTRYSTIIDFMRRAFPDSFDDVLIEQTGPTSVYASIYEHGRRQPIHASGVSDGYLHLLLVLTILFSQDMEQRSLIILDEPEISLHPWALAVLGEALLLATNEWNKQVLVAAHSPVLISQIEPEKLIAAEMFDNQTRLRRLSTIEDVQDLLEHYAPGMLYMAGQVAPQQRIQIDDRGGKSSGMSRE